MFTGIIEETGTIRSLSLNGNSGSIRIEARKVLEKTQLGDSIAVNGVCLTVTSLTPREFTVDVMPETLRRSSLSRLGAGDQVNLERAMSADSRFGGHLVTGHIDGTGTIRSLRNEGNAVLITIAASPEVLSLIVEKGSIAVDGISLTVAGVSSDSFSVSVIPHTGSHTTLLKKQAGDTVNLENDIIGKYVKKFLSAAPAQGTTETSGRREPAKSRLTEDFLRENGF